MQLPAALFPAPDRPTSTIRNSVDDVAGEEEEVAEADGKAKAGVEATVEEGDEEKTGKQGMGVGDASGDLSSVLFILW